MFAVAFTDGPSSTIGSCIMSALSIPPSQKTNISVGLQSIHNYANLLNPVAFVGPDQYSIVAVYTEVDVGTSEVNEQLTESAEVQVQTDFYEEEIVAVSTESIGVEEASGIRAEETSETAHVAKALETLTKTFALRKESLGQDVLTRRSNDSPLNDKVGFGNAVDEGKTSEGCETSDQFHDKTEAHVEQVEDVFHTGDIMSNIMSTNFKSIPVPEDETEVSSQSSVPESQQSASSANIRRSSRLQMKTPPSWQETCELKKRKDVTQEPEMYKNIYTVFLKRKIKT